MTYHSFAVSLGWLAISLGVVGTTSQYRRAQRLGVEGVSLATWVLFVLMGCFWITYGLVSAHSWLVILGSLLIIPLQVAIVIRLAPWRSPRVTGRALAFFLLSCVLPGLLWGWSGGIYGTAVAMTVTRGPQLIELVRHEDASGVSVTTWLVGFIGCVLWVLYYQESSLWAAMIATMFAASANLAIALLATWRHNQARQRLIAEEVFAT